MGALIFCDDLATQVLPTHVSIMLEGRRRTKLENVPKSLVSAFDRVSGDPHTHVHTYIYMYIYIYIYVY